MIRFDRKKKKVNRFEMKMKINSLIFFVSIISLLIDENSSLYIDDYLLSIGDLFLNETFLFEFEKRTLNLSLDRNYYSGIQINPFPCSTEIQSKIPLNVHQLTPNDIQCVGAIGDSLTAALGAHAKTPIGLVTEYRGEFYCEIFIKNKTKTKENFISKVHHGQLEVINHSNN